MTCITTPRHTLLIALSKAALPPRVISSLDDPPQAPVPCASTPLARGSHRLAEEGVLPNSVHAIWHAYARSFPLRSFWLARHAPTGSQCLKCSRMRTTSLRRAVPLPLAQRAMGPGTGATSGMIQYNHVCHGECWPSRQIKIHSCQTGRICVTALTR